MNPSPVKVQQVGWAKTPKPKKLVIYPADKKPTLWQKLGHRLLRRVVVAGALLAAVFLPGQAMATCDISSAFTAGQVLTAAQLNTLVTDSESCTNNVLNGDVFTGSMSFHSGIDALFYSDTGATLKASIDAATGHFIGAPSMGGFHTNCGISNSGTTLTFAGYDGTALSATNPCVVAIRSNTAGRIALGYFTANVTLTHGAASNTDGNLFGIADADWASVLPMFFGVIYDGTTPYFWISRVPHTISSGAAANQCQKDDTDCDTRTDGMILATGLTLANWVSLPITQLGWFDATYATSGGAWTFSVSSRNGFNDLYKQVRFTFPTGQNGASSGTYLNANAGTAAVFTTNNYTYLITDSGIGCVEFYLDGDGGTDGAGAVTASIALPMDSQATFVRGAAGGYVISAGGGTTGLLGEIQALTDPEMFLKNDAGTTMTNANFSNGARTLTGNFCYLMY